MIGTLISDLAALTDKKIDNIVLNSINIAKKRVYFYTRFLHTII